MRRTEKLDRLGIFARYVAGLAFVVSAAPVLADSSSPLLAAYYDRHMAIVGATVYAWRGDDTPKRVPLKGVQVGVGDDTHYVLTGGGTLLGFRNDPARAKQLVTGIARFAAGSSGVLALKTNGALWWIGGHSGGKRKIADKVLAAAVGDGANYYIAKSGVLFVKGRASRGQYGDGRLRTTPDFVRTAAGVKQITAHTGHAILLKIDGDVMGTGGNIYGPVGRHGLGDKAVRWSKIMSGALAIATGSSHSLAIRRDGMLMVWGRGYGPEPKPVMAGVSAVAAGSRATIALKRDGSLWQWAPGKKPRKLLPR